MQLRRPTSPEAAIERGLRALIWDGIFAQALGVLAGGTLLTGCALELGAGPAFIGLLAAIPFFAQLAQVPAVMLVEKLRRRRAICVWTTLMARLLLLPLVLLPVIADRHVALALLLAAIALAAPLAAIGGCSWMSWTADLVPHHRLGEVFGRRQLRANIAGVAAALLGGAIVNGWGEAFPGGRAGGYAGVFALAFAAAMASSWCLARMPDRAMPPPRRASLGARFALPFRARNFRRVMIFLGCWQFAANLALPLFPVYLVRQLDYPITAAIGLGMVSQLAGTAALPFWGRLCDRWANKTALALSAPLFLCCPAGWVLAAAPATNGVVLPPLVALQLVLGVALAGLDLAGGNIALKLAPRAEATVFLGVNGLVKSLCAGAAPLIGGFLLNRLKLGGGLLPWQLFFLATGLLGLAALTRLAAIEEEGHRPVRVLVAEAVRRFLPRRFRRSVDESSARAADDHSSGGSIEGGRHRQEAVADRVGQQATASLACRVTDDARSTHPSTPPVS